MAEEYVDISLGCIWYFTCRFVKIGGPTNTSMDYSPFDTNGLWTLSLVLLPLETCQRKKNTER